MNRIKRIVLITTMCMVIMCASMASMAASSSWNIYYVPGGSASVSSQTTTTTIPYYSAGYKAYCSSYSGANGSQLSITSSSAGEIKDGPIYITSTGYTRDWKMKSSTTGNVVFQLKARVNYYCSASGDIHTVS